ncbi:MAG: hypothetical protein ABI614_19630 [Planctomycetota bacterium]
MNERNEDDLDTRLGSLTPLSAPSNLRAAVMSKVDRELAGKRSVRWDRRLAIAASLLLAVGIAANEVVDHEAQRRLAILLGPVAVPRNVSDYTGFVNCVVDAEASEQIERYLLAIRPPRAKRSDDFESGRRHVEAIINALTFIEKGDVDAKTLEGRQVDGDRGADIFRGTLDRRRGAELASERSA